MNDSNSPPKNTINHPNNSIEGIDYKKITDNDPLD
jgi:hypothetical protein